ncbi:MAG: phage/plasmid primase, P4 family [Isosphaeraceae bacterium]
MQRDHAHQPGGDALGPGQPGPRPLDLAGWLTRQGEAGPPRGPAARAASPTCPGDLAGRAARYLDRMPPAVSGQRGHDRTFHAACVLIKRFGLSVEEARPLLADWNRRCEPPWSERELDHKLTSAAAAVDDRPRGDLAGHGGSDKPRQGRPPAAAAASSVPTVAEGQETNPHRLAALFLEQRFAHPDGPGLRYWCEQFHEWDGSAYRPVAQAEIRAQVTQTLAAEFDRLFRAALEARSASTDGGSRRRLAPRPIPVTGRLVSDVIQALSGMVLLKAAEVPRQPAWLDGPAPAGAAPRWPIDETLPARRALVHLPSLAAGRRCTLPSTPQFFNAYALDYDFVPDAPEPGEWLRFLGELWGGDPESIDCLQEWFGYLLMPDTRQQKILMMVGPKRSGRGTIARVLKALVGAGNVVNPTLATLARPFGLAPLIDKPVAVFPDARLSSRPDNAAIVECLLSISGEDDQTVDRKHLPSWTGRLPTRFVLISNELPRLRDASGALASRLILLPFTRSFYGREDTALFDRLGRELPGILLWAIAGWQRLRARGRFVQPRSGRELLEAMEDLGSPISAFLRDRCVVGPDESVEVSALYDTWRSWCQEQGKDAIIDEPSFGRDLRAAVPGLSKSRFRRGSSRVAHYRGVRLRTSLDPDPDRDDDPAS